MATPSRWSALAFGCKAWGLRLQRRLRDGLRGRPPRHAPGTALSDAPVLAEFRDGLWSGDDADAALVAGKVQNLRVARRHLHAIEVAAGAQFSFWRQLGRATRARGYARGRELREGCLIPTLGGGLCQLSNAIYDCALRAGVGIVERHRHSRVIPGSLAERDRDATVFWNYLDLRLAAPFAWRLEVALDEDALRVTIRGRPPHAGAVPLPVAIAPRDAGADSPGDCTDCGQDDCHRHVGPQRFMQRRTWILAEDWPEFRAYRAGWQEPADRVLAAASLAGRIAVVATKLRRRYLLHRGVPLPRIRMGELQALARRCAARLHADDIDLVVPQGLLPFLWRDGALAGRRFGVLMTALPMHALQAQLDRASQAQPGVASLRDFRADAGLLQAERDALAAARHWITPHAGIAALAGQRAVLLDWQLPAPLRKRHEREGGLFHVALAGSPLARKGACELRDAVRGLPLRVLLPPGDSDSAVDWEGVRVRRLASYNEAIALADAVVLPAWIEHQPRGLLAALASGLPVIATPACGLHGVARWTSIAEGDAAALRAALVDTLALVA